MRSTLALLALAAGGAAAEVDALPPIWEASCIFHHAFSGPAPLVAREVAFDCDPDGAVADGFLGAGWQVNDQRGGLHLRGPALERSPPLTVMAWWRLADQSLATWTTSLLGLAGHGRIEFFVRDGGRDGWCGLTQPTGVFQVYVPGIANINDIWGYAPLGLARPPAGWHHVAMVAGRQSVDVLWDGALAQHYGLKGRALAAGDLRSASIGPLWPGHTILVVDEVIALDRAAPADEIADYVRAARALRERSGR